jgi:hypothetical protein
LDFENESVEEVLGPFSRVARWPGGKSLQQAEAVSDARTWAKPGAHDVRDTVLLGEVRASREDGPSLSSDATIESFGLKTRWLAMAQPAVRKTVSRKALSSNKKSIGSDVVWEHPLFDVSF